MFKTISYYKLFGYIIVFSAKYGFTSSFVYFNIFDEDLKNYCLSFFISRHELNFVNINNKIFIDLHIVYYFEINY